MRIASLLIMFVAAFVGLPAVAACADSEASHEPAHHAMSNVSGWTSGEVLEVDLDDGTLVLRHGKIDAWNMAAMESMVFKAHDPRRIARLKANDKVSFRAGMVGTQPTIKDIKPASK